MKNNDKKTTEITAIEFGKKFIISNLLAVLAYIAVEFLACFPVVWTYEDIHFELSLIPSFTFTSTNVFALELRIIQFVAFVLAALLFYLLFFRKSKKFEFKKALLYVVAIRAAYMLEGLFYGFFSAYSGEGKAIVNLLVSAVSAIMNILITLLMLWAFDNLFFGKRSFKDSAIITFKRLGYYILLGLVPAVLLFLTLLISNQIFMTPETIVAFGMDTTILYLQEKIPTAMFMLLLAATVIYPKCYVKLLNSRADVKK